MSSERATIDARVEPIRGPWEDPVKASLPTPLPGTDPRLELTDQALVLASQNAFPVVATQKARRDHMGLAAGGAIALVLGGATFMSLSSSRHVPAAAPTAVAATASNPMQLRQALPAPGVPQPMPMPMAGSAAPAQVPQPMPGMGHMPGAMVMPGTSPGSAPVLVYDGSAPRMSPSGGSGSAMTHDAGGAPGLLAGATMAGGAAISDNSSARATKLAEPANTVAQGTLIPAVLETAIDTDVPGFARAVVSQDVRSFDGSRVLIPRSSRLIGEYKGVTQAGQRRAYLIWTRLIRPDGVSIALASPAADFTGQAGIGGQVNSHFFSRFGSSILLSILGGAGSLVTGGASTVVVSGGQSAASVAAQHDGNRPPTIKVQQGEPIRVFTARDLIFSEAGSNG
jgi:type IV secretion system protein VirB10